jgi:serralysin
VPSNTFADVDGDDLDYSAVVVDDSGQPLASQPSWLIFDRITRTFSGNPPLSFVGYLNIKLIASDGFASASDTFKLTITAASKPAVIGDPSDSSVIEDVGIINGKLSASGTISISDENAGEAAFQTSVLSTKGNLGSLALKSDGTYTYSVLNRATQELGDGMTKVDTFTIKSMDGTAKVISFTIVGANEVLTGTARDDKISGSNAHETINGLGGNDTLIGSAGNDKLYGGEGSDNLNGGPGADLLFGGSGRDTFIFTSVGDAGYGSNRDVIGDFASGFDTIDLRSIDANTKIGKDQAFTFVAQQSTSAVANSITWHQADGVTIVQGEVNGDSIADFQIQLAGVQSLSASNFVL